jgi:hypothetical protein
MGEKHIRSEMALSDVVAALDASRAFKSKGCTIAPVL